MRRGRSCAEHRDGLNGALMGMLKCEEILPFELEDIARQPKKKRPQEPEKKFTRVGHAQRRGGNNDARTARTGPGTRVSHSHIERRERSERDRNAAMNEMHFTQKSCGAGSGAAEREQDGAERSIAEQSCTQSRAKTRGVAKVSAVTKPDPGISFIGCWKLMLRGKK
jgi:hypothetical protein